MEWDHDLGTAAPTARIDRGLLSVTREAFAERNEVIGADFGQFRDVLNSHFYPASVEPLDAGTTLLSPSLSAVHLPHVTIALVRFGAAARVDPGNLSTYHVNVALRGQVQSQYADEVVVASPRDAAVFSPEAHTKLSRWDSDATQLCIKLDRAAVELELAGLLGHSVTRSIRFDLAFPLHRDGGRTWTALLTALLMHSRMPPVGGKPHPVVAQLERSLLTGLLMAQPHSYTDELFGHDRAGSTREVRRVVATIESAPETPFTVGDLARVAGLSSRSLQAAFQRDLGVSPMAYLRQVRLERAHDDLILGTGQVSDVAYHWGFSNLGRFAHQYRARFGELPSETVTRSL